MDIQTLQAFIEVARKESFSLASETLYITQPAISKRIAALEDDLGTKLFNRISRKVSLTDAGEKLLPKAKELVLELNDMRRYATSLSDEIRGELLIGTSHHVSMHRLPPIFRKYRQQYNDVHLDMTFGESDIMCKLVERGEIELAVVTLPKTLPDSLNKQVLWVDSLHLVVGPDHPLLKLSRMKQSKITLEQLAEYPCVLPSEVTETYRVINREMERSGLTLNVQMTNNNLDTLKMLVGAGFGWTLLPQTLLDNSVQEIKLDKIEIQFERELGVVIHRKRSLSNAAKAMQKMLDQSK
ncbi:MAG: DNA-binding transcriptional LysR family regulator [Cocleimonas sp.]|jgi:DNA-binding transcriptional LysR family regulator